VQRHGRGGDVRLPYKTNNRDIAAFWWQKIAGKNASLMGIVEGVVVSAHKADGARPRQKTQHRMRSDTKEKEHKRLDHRARSAPERRN